METAGQSGMDEEDQFLAMSSQKAIKELHSDKDYDASNATLNRVKQFTFAGGKRS